MTQTPAAPPQLSPDPLFVLGSPERIAWIFAQADVQYAIYTNPQTSQDDFIKANTKLNDWCRQFWPELESHIKAQASTLTQAQAAQAVLVEALRDVASDLEYDLSAGPLALTKLNDALTNLPDAAQALLRERDVLQKANAKLDEAAVFAIKRAEAAEARVATQYETILSFLETDSALKATVSTLTADLARATA